MTRSATHLRRTVGSVAGVAVAAAILVPSASAFWLGGGLQQPSANTPSNTSNVVKTKHDTAKNTLNNIGPSY
jgi:hypothetical protein